MKDIANVLSKIRWFCLIAIVITALTSGYVVRAQDKAAGVVVNPLDKVKLDSVFTNESIKKGTTPRAGIGGRIRIKVVGLSDAIKNKLDPNRLVLYLDGIELKGVEPSVVDVSSGVLEFKLERNADSRKAWDTLLGSPTRSEKNVSVNVGLTNGQTLELEDSKNVMTLIVFDPPWFAVSSIGFLIVVALFWWRAIKGNIIRDSNPPKPSGDQKKPYSLARLQMAIWFFLVFGSFVFLYLITSDYNTITEQALILMGIGTGTALGAAAIDASKRTTADSCAVTSERGT